MAQNGKANKVGAGLGVAAATAAAALGAYFLYGSKNAAKNRKTVKAWMVKAKGEVMERLENMEEVTENTYQDVVNKVIARYKGMKGVSAAEIASLAVDLKKHWTALKPLAKKAKGTAGRATSKVKKTSRRPSGKGTSSKGSAGSAQ